MPPRRKTDDRVIIEMLRAGKMQKEIAEHFGCSAVAVSRRIKRINQAIKTSEVLKDFTKKEQDFCLEVASGKTKTNAALASFDCGSRESAKSIGIELMRRDDINKAVSEIMDSEGLGKRVRVRKLREHVSNVDPGISLRALDQTWRLDGAYTEKHVHTENITVLTGRLKDIDQEIAELERQIGISSAEGDPIDADFNEVD